MDAHTHVTSLHGHAHTHAVDHTLHGTYMVWILFPSCIRIYCHQQKETLLLPAWQLVVKYSYYDDVMRRDTDGQEVNTREMHC